MAERSPPVYPEGGFDGDFVEPPPNRLCCSICLHPLRDPLRSSCGHSFCTSCHRTRFQISQLCPVCNLRYTTLPDAGIAREMKEYECVHCRKYVSTYNDVTTNHWPVCDFIPVPCPNECPEGRIPRSCLMEHIKSTCTVKTDGKQLAEVKSQCDDLLERIRHLQECLERRNAEAHSQDSRIEELESKHQELLQELGEKDKKISEMEKELEELRTKLHQQSSSTSLLGTLKSFLFRPGWEDDDLETQKWREKELRW